jgi:hypothetical protein
MCYNIISFFVPMDFNMYSIYYLGIKGLDDVPSNFLKDSNANLKVKTIKERIGVRYWVRNT